MNPEPRYRWDGTGMEKGTMLLSCLDTPAWMQGVVDFHEATGLTAAEIVADPLLTTALPVYPDSMAKPRWETAHTRQLWHPLFWLPERLRPVRTDAEGTEPLKVWALRLGLELNASTLYEPDRGWRDVLADQGIDIDTPGGLDRVALWQAGRRDSVLDEFTVAPYLSGGEGDWAMEMARTLVLTAQERLWALVSDELIGWIDELADDDRDQAHMIVMVADEILTEASPDATQIWTRAQTQIERAGTSGLRQARSWLEEVRANNWDSLVAIQEAFTQGAAA